MWYNQSQEHTGISLFLSCLVPNLFHDGYMYYTREDSLFYTAQIDLAATSFKYGTGLDQTLSQIQNGQDPGYEQFNLGSL